MIRHTKRAFIFLLGLVFLVLGVLGLALPFLQGFLFIAIGLLLLSIYSPSLREWVEHHTRRYPRLHRMVLKAQEFINRIIGEV